MSQDIFEPWNTLNKNLFESFKKLGELNIRIGEKLLQEQIDLVNSLIEANSRNAESASKAKGVQDVLSNNSAAAQECSKRILQSYRSCADTLANARQEYSSLMEKSLEDANKNFKAANEKKAA